MLLSSEFVRGKVFSENVRMKETVTLNTQDQQRLLVLNRILAGHLSVAEAAPILEVTERQMWRILAAYRKEGAAAIVHGNRGRSPSHRISDEVRRQVIALAQGPYRGCNQQHLRDLLEERDGIALSRASVHRLLQEAHLLAEPSQRPPQHRRRRERAAQEGMLVQIDGSRHAWLEERGPWLSLIAAIDDATGKLLAAVFREQEDAQGYFLLVRQLVSTVGRPLALYHDRHGIFAQTTRASERDSIAEQLAGTPTPTQFGRLLQKLGIRSIAARSPQAKGRVERLFGTLQERLVVELRLAGITSLEAANGALQGYLSRFNARFAVPAADPTLAYLPWPTERALEEVCCFKYLRTVAADNTISFGGQCLQLGPGRDRRSYAHAEVEVQEHLDGHLVVRYGTHVLSTTAAPADAPTLRARAGRRAAATPTAAESETPSASSRALTAGIPATRYSWKQPFLPKKPKPPMAQKQLP